MTGARSGAVRQKKRVDRPRNRHRPCEASAPQGKIGKSAHRTPFFFCQAPVSSVKLTLLIECDQKPEIIANKSVFFFVFGKRECSGTPSDRNKNCTIDAGCASMAPEPLIA